MFRGLFVTGTDTNVGKTVVAAAVLHRYRREAPLRYWKPVQTGVEHDDDTAEVMRLAGASDDEIFNCGIRLPGAVSPHLAARRSGTYLAVRRIVQMLEKEPADTRWIIEGAGGVFAPLSDRESMLDLIDALDVPVLIAARSTLGTINHTRLTVEALRRRNHRVAGVVMVGPPSEDNRTAIEWHARAEVVGQMPIFDPLSPEALAHWVELDFDRAGVLFGSLR